MAKSIKLGHINMYAGNKTPAQAMDVMLGRMCASIGINEGYPFLNIIQRQATEYGYRMFVGQGGRDSRRGSLDTPMLVKKKLPMLVEMSIFASASSQPVKIAPDRFFTIVGYRHAVGNVIHINIHPHAAVRGLDARKNDRAAKYVESIKLLKRIIKFYQSLGYIVFVTGDANLHEGDKILYGTTPFQVFDLCGMGWEATDLDLIAYPKDTFMLQDFVKVSEKQTGSDHDAFWARLRQIETGGES